MIGGFFWYSRVWNAADRIEFYNFPELLVIVMQPVNLLEFLMENLIFSMVQLNSAISTWISICPNVNHGTANLRFFA